VPEKNIRKKIVNIHPIKKVQIKKKPASIWLTKEKACTTCALEKMPARKRQQPPAPNIYWSIP
jgi:hypothetical protein